MNVLGANTGAGECICSLFIALLITQTLHSDLGCLFVHTSIPLNLTLCWKQICSRHYQTFKPSSLVSECPFVPGNVTSCQDTARAYSRHHPLQRLLPAQTSLCPWHTYMKDGTCGTSWPGQAPPELSRKAGGMRLGGPGIFLLLLTPP